MQGNQTASLMIQNKTLLITGGTGSLGRAIANEAIKRNAGKVIIFSRDENEQVRMARDIGNPLVRYFLGDVRDKYRLNRALDGVSFVIHCAALKHVDKCEYDPIEAIQTNIIGAQNLIDVSIDRKISKVIAISSDKAVNPINLYGATKLCADKLFIAANAYSPGKTKFAVARFGNFIGSRGSVVRYFQSLKDKGVKQFPITDPRMTRFFISLEDAASFVFWFLGELKGGEMFTPKMEAKYIHRVAHEIDPDAKLIEVGIRPGEKLSEDLIIADDSGRTWDCGDYYCTMPANWDREPKGKKVMEGWSYNSEDAVE